MIFCSFGNAYRITGNQTYKNVIAEAAETLIKRYRSATRTIQSWGRMKDSISPVIIDNMMNLELLNWVSDEWREPKYKVIEIDHANTTLKNHFRPDNSSYHVLDYDVNTGNVIRKKTAQVHMGSGKISFRGRLTLMSSMSSNRHSGKDTDRLSRKK